MSWRDFIRPEGALRREEISPCLESLHGRVAHLVDALGSVRSVLMLLGQFFQAQRESYPQANPPFWCVK
jgi:hypothetical protein